MMGSIQLWDIQAPITMQPHRLIHGCEQIPEPISQRTQRRARASVHLSGK